MKKLLLIMTAVFLGTTMTKAETLEDKVVINSFNYGNSFIFVENGVTFSVYPDGEFDFYINNQVNVNVGARIGNVGVTFNSGRDYNAYVQYDDYGAILQVESVPVYYDDYGRVAQIGDINVTYRNGRVRRVGGLVAYYNGTVFSHYTGYINRYNRSYVYTPYHRYFSRPAVNFCNVYRTPYRINYNPVRYTYYSPYRNNTRRVYAAIGRSFKYNRTNRANVYRNDRRVTVRNNNSRRNTTVRNNNRGRNNNGVASRNTTRNQRNNVSRSTTTRRNTTTNRNSNNRAVAQRSNRGNTTTQRTTTRTPNRTTTTNRTVTRTPNRTVTSRTTTTKSNRSSSSNNRNSVRNNTSSQKRTVSRSSRSSSNNSSSRTSRRSLQ